MAFKINPDLPLIRQYDKLLAVAVLIFLLTSLFYLTNAGATRKQQESNYIRGLEEGLKPETALAPPMELAVYEEAARLARTPGQMEVPPAQQAGFLSPERRVTCVAAACLKPIPYAAEKCPFCEAAQPTPDELRTDLDSDKDGIPDKIEAQLGLNPQDPADAKADLDKDGFSNLDEVLAKTDPKNPQSHPALVNLLRVKELRGKLLPLIFSGVNKMPDGVQLVFNQTTGTPPRTFWVREGEKIGDTGFAAGKVEVKFEERANPNMNNMKIRVDVSTVVVKRLSDNKEVTLKVKEVGKNTDVEAVIVLPLDNAEYVVLENGTFKVRDETYRVISVDNATTSVVIENESSKQQKAVRKLD